MKRYGLGQIGKVVGVVCVVLLGSNGLATAQQHEFERAAQQYEEARRAQQDEFEQAAQLQQREFERAAQQYEEARRAQQDEFEQAAQLQQHEFAQAAQQYEEARRAQRDEFEQAAQLQQREFAQAAQLARQRVAIAAPDSAGGSRIGLSIEDVTDNDAADEGALVRDVRADSPAASAGFADGDVIVEFDGERVRSARQLTRLVQDTPSGRTVEAAVLRDGRRVELEVTPESSGAFWSVQARPNVDIVSGYTGLAPGIYFGANRGAARLGVRVQELSSQLADYFGVDDGVLVSRVDEDSVASEAGLQAGDVITSVDGRAVGDSDSLRRRLSATGPGEDVSIGLTRAGRALELTATMSDEGQRRLDLQRLRRLYLGSDGQTI